MTRLRCGMPEAYLSALVDDALSARARERVAVHVLHCHSCRDAVAGLRRTADWVRRSGREDAGSPCHRLADRLLAIPGAPDRRGEGATAGSTSTGRRPTSAARSLRAAAVAVVATLVTAGGVAAVGWSAAPEGAEVADPGTQARLELVNASGQRPLAAPASDAAMTAPADQLAVPERDLTGVRVVAGPRWDADEVADLVMLTRSVASRTSYTGTWRVLVADGPTQLAGRVSLRAAAGQGTSLETADLRGRPVQSSFVPAGAPSRLDAVATGADELAGRLTATGGQLLLGRPAVVIEHAPVGRAEPVTRWWVDTATGLVLRRERWQADRLVEAGWFTELHYAGTVTGVQERASTSATTSTLTMSAAMALSRNGWYCRRAVGGLRLVDARSDAGATPGVLALTYADASQTVTVVQRPGTLPEELAGFVHDEARGVWVRPGWPATIAWQSGPVVFTVTSTAADSTVDAVLADLPHEPERPASTVERIRAGWERIGSQVFG